MTRTSSFVLKSSRLFRLVLGVLLATSLTLAMAAPDSVHPGAPETFDPTLKSSPDAVYQVSTSGNLTFVTVSSGRIYVNTWRHPVKVYTRDGLISTDCGEMIVEARANEVALEVLRGKARLNSPYITSAGGEKSGLVEIGAGESAQGQLMGPDEQAVLHALGQHE